MGFRGVVTVKKYISALLCLFLIPGILFAASTLPAPRTLTLVHFLSSNATYHFSFKDMADTPSDISSADVTGGGRFARVVINFNDDVSYSINLRFSPLAHVTVANSYCEYTMEILQPGTNASLVTVIPDTETGHSACYASLSGTKAFAMASGSWQNEYLAELKITLDTDSAIAGNYAGTIIIEQVTDGGS